MENRMQVTLSGVERKMIVYMGADPQYGAKVEEGIPHEMPIGTVIRQTATWLTDLKTFDGKKLLGIKGLALAAGPREFLRGRVVEGEEAQQLLVPPEMRELQAMLGGVIEVEVMTIGGGEEHLRVVAIKQKDGTEVGVILQAGDIAPPPDASRYAVGESPEELAAAGVDASADERRHCPGCLRPHLSPGQGITAVEAAEEIARRLREAEGGDFDFPDDEDDLEDEDIPTAEAVDDEDRSDTGGEGGN